MKKIASPSIPGSPTTTTAGGEATGQDKSSAAGIFVPTVEHVHGGGGVLVFVVVLALALALIWCCARRRLSWGCMADRVGGFLLRKVFDIRLCMFPSCSHCFTGLRTYFVSSVAQLLHMLVNSGPVVISLNYGFPALHSARNNFLRDCDVRTETCGTVQHIITRISEM